MTSNNMHAHLSHPKYRPDIDGLRAVAVLSVLFFHAFPDYLKGGFIGVDIFFVISGYLISTIIFENLKSNSFSFIEFYSRRVRRIFPSLFVVMAASFIAGWFILSADEMKMLGKHMVGGATFLSNIILWRESGYFDIDAETKILLHLWSLGIEEQFYIVWPLMVWAAWKKKFNALGVLLTFAIISFALNIHGIADNPVGTFFSPQTRFWELLAGAFLAYMTLFHPEKLNVCKVGNGTIQSIVGLGLITASIFLVTKDVAFPGWWAVLPVLGAVLLIFSGMGAWVNKYILSSKPFVWVGLISFPLYLWHWPLLSFTRIVEVDLPPVGTRIGLVVLAFILSLITYQFIEKPLRFGKKTNRNAIGLCLAMAFIALVGGITFIKGGFQNRQAAQPFLDFIYSAVGQKPCDAQSDIGKLGLKYCAVAQHGDVPVNAAIIGDSHAEDKFSGLSNVDITRNWMLVGHMACPPVYGVNVIIHSDECQSKSEKVIDWVAGNPDIKTAVLSFYGHYALTEVYAADHQRDNQKIKNSKIIKAGDTTSSREDLLYDGLNTTIKKLLASHKKVIVLVDVPDLPYFPKDCVRKQSDCAIPKTDVLKRQSENMIVLDRLKKSNPQISIYNPTDLFCDSQSCTYKKDDVILYRDSHHLSLRGSRLYAERLLKWMENRK